MLSIQFTRKRISMMLCLVVVQLIITSNRNAHHIYPLAERSPNYAASVTDFFNG